MKPHPVDLTSLIFGAVFLGIAVLWLLVRFTSAGWPLTGWVAAAALATAGGLGIILALRASRRAGDPDRSE